jgi:hypothetical protein
MDPELRDALINDFISRSFRDVADKDYITARILHRYNLDPQFLWAALQAIEKYLKGILLYNRVSTKGLSHDIAKGLERLSRIKDIPFQIPDDVKTFITYLNREGANRYFEHPAFVMGREIFDLDRTVWHFRRYCYWMRGPRALGAGQGGETLPLAIQDVHSVSEQQAHKYRIAGGYLEAVLAKRESELRKHLVWKNFYCGSDKKQRVKNVQKRIWSANPTHYLQPEIFEELSQLVQFSKEVQTVFKDL